MKMLTIAGVVALVGLGVFLLASYWAGQTCYSVYFPCIHPEWIALGVMSLIVAGLLFARSR